MGAFLVVAAILFLIVGVIGHIWLLYEAYNDDNTHGWLCLMCGPYALYYAFVRLDSENRWVIIGLWLGGEIPSGILFQIAKNF